MVPAQLTTDGQVASDPYLSTVKSEAQHPYQTRVRSIPRPPHAGA